MSVSSSTLSTNSLCKEDVSVCCSVHRHQGRTGRGSVLSCPPDVLSVYECNFDQIVLAQQIQLGVIRNCAIEIRVVFAQVLSLIAHKMFYFMKNQSTSLSPLTRSSAGFKRQSVLRLNGCAMRGARSRKADQCRLDGLVLRRFSLSRVQSLQQPFSDLS